MKHAIEQLSYEQLKYGELKYIDLDEIEYEDDYIAQVSTQAKKGKEAVAPQTQYTEPITQFGYITKVNGPVIVRNDFTKV